MSRIKPETQSNWECVSDQLKDFPSLIFGKQISEWFYNTPNYLLNFLIQYKFASKLIGKGKKVLDISCKEGMGTYLIAKECGFAKGIDSNGNNIEMARKNFCDENIEFEQIDFSKNYQQNLTQWDAVVSFGTLSTAFPPDFEKLLNYAAKSITENGLIILGIFLEADQKNMQENTLRSIIDTHFIHSFFFSIYGEIIKAGYFTSADGIIVVGCKRKITS